VATFEGSENFQAPIKGGINLEAIFLPISSDRLLIGMKNKGFDKFDPDALNTASAELSRDFFIASRNTDKERGYLSNLGKRSALFNKEKMEQLVQESLTERK